jgi:hypothetical protein
MNRQYDRIWGRFTAADPYQASAGAEDPGSWNRYAYVQGDPVNYGDPNGLARLDDYHACLFRAPAAEFSWNLNAWARHCENRNNLVEWSTIKDQDTGRGGGGGFVRVQPKVPAGNNYTRQQMQGLTNGLNNALTHTDQVDCATFFAGGDDDPSLRVGYVLENTLYRLLPLPQGSGTGAQTIDVSNVMINTAGAFFNAAPNANGTVTVFMPNAEGVQTQFTFADTSALRGFMLLHELGHQMAVFGDDVSAAINGANSQAVLDACFKRDAQGIYH